MQARAISRGSAATAPASASTACAVASRKSTGWLRRLVSDMAAAGWRPAVEKYLGRVTKHRILEAVREAKVERAA